MYTDAQYEALSVRCNEKPMNSLTEADLRRELRTASGDVDTAYEALREIALDPLLEDLHQYIMAAHEQNPLTSERMEGHLKAANYEIQEAVELADQDIQESWVDWAMDRFE